MKNQYVTIARKSFFSCGVTREDCGTSGFNYCFEVYIKGPINPVSGLVINLTDVKTVLASIIDQLDQKHLNYDIQPPLNDLSLNNIHQYIHDIFLEKFKSQKLTNISITQTTLKEGLSYKSSILCR